MTQVDERRFIESSDEADEAWRRASEYGELVRDNPAYRGWLVTVRRMRTGRGQAFAIEAVKGK
jgi:hypothetical protein